MRTLTRGSSEVSGSQAVLNTVGIAPRVTSGETTDTTLSPELPEGSINSMEIVEASCAKAAAITEVQSAHPQVREGPIAG